MQLKLLMFAPCEKVILSEEKTSSLITVIEGMKIDISEPLPDDASLPMKWNIVTLWHRIGEAEPDVRYEQKVVILSPKGIEILTLHQGFPVTNQNQNYRNIAEVLGFPIQSGEMLIKLSMRQSGKDADWQEIAEFPVTVTVILKEPVKTPEANQ